MNTKNRFPSDKEAIEGILEVGRRMYMRGFVAANDGNISCKVSESEIWATPTGVSKGFMTADMMVKLDLDGKILSGSYAPSSELKMHLRLYRENPEICAVTHAHPPVATTFAAAKRPLDEPILQEAVVQLGIVPLADFALPGTEGVADSVAPFCKAYNGCLLANHGALSWGADVFNAFFRLESIEYYATVLMHSEAIGKSPLTNKQIEELLKIREKLGIKQGGKPIGV